MGVRLRSADAGHGVGSPAALTKSMLRKIRTTQASPTALTAVTSESEASASDELNAREDSVSTDMLEDISQEHAQHRPPAVIEARRPQVLFSTTPLVLDRQACRKWGASSGPSASQDCSPLSRLFQNETFVLMAATGEAEPDEAHSRANLKRPSLPAAKTVAFIKANRWEKEAREAREAQPRASRQNRVLHQRQQDNGRDAGRGQRRSARRSSRVPPEPPSPVKVSAALVAAHSPDFTRRLGTAFALTTARERGEGTIEEKYADAEEELLVLRQELRRERDHGFREMREIRIGWEDAEARATALERQVVYLRCSEEVLSAELGYSEELVSWWKQATW